MKDHESSPGNAFRALLSQLGGSSANRPRLQVTRNVWRKNARTAIEQETRRRAEEEGVPTKNLAPVRERVAKEMYDALDDTKKAYWETRAKTEHATAIKKWQEGLTSPPSTAPLDRLQCIQAFPDFIQPILDGICAYTGWRASIIIGGPSPAHNGRLTMLSVHSGTTKGDTEMNWGKSEGSSYSNTVGASFASFLQKCYTPDDCQEFAVNDNEERCFLHYLPESAEVHELPSATDTPRLSSPTASSARANFTAGAVANGISTSKSKKPSGPANERDPVRPLPVPRQPPTDSAPSMQPSFRLLDLPSENSQVLLGTPKPPSPGALPESLPRPPSVPLSIQSSPRPSPSPSPRLSLPPSPRPSQLSSPHTSRTPSRQSSPSNISHQEPSTAADVPAMVPLKRPSQPIANPVTVAKKRRVSLEDNMPPKRIRKATAKNLPQSENPYKSATKPKA